MTSIVGLLAVGGVGQIQLRWSIADPHARGLPYLRVHHVEIWRADGMAGLDWQKIGETSGSQFADLAVSPGATFCYRARAVDASGNVGDFCAEVMATTLILRVEMSDPVLDGGMVSGTVTYDSAI